MSQANSMEADNMYTHIPDDEKQNSIDQFFEEQKRANPNYTGASFVNRWPRTLEHEIMSIVRGYQRLRRLYNPIHGSNTDTQGTQKYSS